MHILEDGVADSKDFRRWSDVPDVLGDIVLNADLERCFQFEHRRTWAWEDLLIPTRRLGLDSQEMQNHLESLSAM